MRKTVIAYIDGFNFYHAVCALGEPQLKWVNLNELMKSLVRHGETLNEVRFYTTVCTWNKDKTARHQNFIAAQRAHGVKICEGKFSRSAKWCEKQARNCNFREEKYTDVAIAVDMVSHAFAGRYDRAILLTADHDQVPTVKTIIETFPQKQITIAAPPGRLQHARELVSLASNAVEIKASRVQACLLPYLVTDSSGIEVARKPDAYSARPDAPPENSN